MDRRLRGCRKGRAKDELSFLSDFETMRGFRCRSHCSDKVEKLLKLRSSGSEYDKILTALRGAKLDPITDALKAEAKGRRRSSGEVTPSNPARSREFSSRHLLIRTKGFMENVTSAEYITIAFICCYRVPGAVYITFSDHPDGVASRFRGSYPIGLSTLWEGKHSGFPRDAIIEQKHVVYSVVNPFTGKKKGELALGPG